MQNTTVREGERSSLNSALEVNTQGERCVDLDSQRQAMVMLRTRFCYPRAVV